MKVKIQFFALIIYLWHLSTNWTCLHHPAGKSIVILFDRQCSYVPFETASAQTAINSILNRAKILSTSRMSTFRLFMSWNLAKEVSSIYLSQIFHNIWCLEAIWGLSNESKRAYFESILLLRAREGIVFGDLLLEHQCK